MITLGIDIGGRSIKLAARDGDRWLFTARSDQRPKAVLQDDLAQRVRIVDSEMARDIHACERTRPADRGLRAGCRL